ncbi:hypothetical protein ACFQ48_11785 [Hymenobacter caeli]|uniref:Photosystem II stability/assembly factor-like uncharacterized protein n=1 Tax=Hymenobacter caeli TaxID=2735894 RepID=A0ABX2FSL7_9BACT|nr:hypothetical protein [Hymenobacter caeli]NRT20006.1 photosystem II stability/assembly factor-like uncharacterized protein [Hymenobacter caeli]
MRFRYACLSVLLLSLATGCGRRTDPAPAQFTWTTLPYGTPALTSFSEVYFMSSRVGWVIGGYTPDQSPGQTSVLLATRDGGATWTRTALVPLLTYYSGFGALAPVSEQLVFASGFAPTGNQSAPRVPATYKSLDGGATWQRLPGAGYAGGARLYFFNEQTGLAFADRQIQRTTDGGASWQPVFAPATGNWDKVQFPAAAVGYAAGGYVSYGTVLGGYLSSGSLAKTIDQGATWQALPWEHGNISSLSFISATVGFAATFPNNQLFKTRDAGASWQLVNAQLPPLGNVSFLSEQEAYATNNQQIQHTTDGGLTWQKAYEVPSNSKYSTAISSLIFPTPTAGFGVTPDGQLIKGTR